MRQAANKRAILGHARIIFSRAPGDIHAVIDATGDPALDLLDVTQNVDILSIASSPAPILVPHRYGEEAGVPHVEYGRDRTWSAEGSYTAHFEVFRGRRNHGLMGWKVEEPDIQFVDEEGDESDEVKRCSSHPEDRMSFGWTGNWTRKLLAADKKNHRHPQTTDPALGFLDRVIWSIGSDDPPLWGMRVNLVPVPGRTTQADVWCEDCKPEKERLKSYEIRATVLEVYVRPSFFDERERITETSSKKVSSDDDV
ncbi:hypothetical protein BDZ89DRAFT_1053830 [Hymenopellis radicata]|nr:hypothetical protein BDZ89DRAFT_1053830 [Hymenopellis radicata]